VDNFKKPETQQAPPIRPLRLLDEWSETYLGRTARALGVRRPWRQDLETLRSLQPMRVSADVTGLPTYNNEQLPGWAVLGRGAQIRYCCTCLLDQRYIRARWRIAFMAVCTVHDINLKEGLVEPAITAAYKHPGKRLVAEISEDEAVAEATSPTPIGLRYARGVWSGFERAVLAGATGDALVDPLAWALLVERLLDALATAVRGLVYPTKDVPRHEHRGWWLQKMELSVAPERGSVLALLLRLSEGAHRRAAIACLGRLIEDETRRRTVMSRLPLQELKDRLLAATPSSRATAYGALPRAKHPMGCKSLEVVEVVLGCKESLVRLLVEEGHFRGVEKIKFGRKQYVFIPDEEVERMRRLLAACMTFDELLVELAIDRQAYWALHDCGLLTPMEFGAWRRYRRQEVSSLLTRLDNVARPMPAHLARLLPLMGSWLHMRHRARSSMKQVLDELLEGRLPAYKSLEQDGLRAYFVDHTAPARLMWLSETHYAAKSRERAMATQLPLWETA
jgi:hypothetical protein